MNLRASDRVAVFSWPTDVMEEMNARIGSLALTFQQRTGDIASLMKHLWSSITPGTLSKYAACWAKFKIWLYPATLAMVDDMVVCLYVSHLIGTAESNSTGHQVVDNAVSFLFWAHGPGFAHPFSSLHTFETDGQTRSLCGEVDL
jgi:hypothetical protein